MNIINIQRAPIFKKFFPSFDNYIIYKLQMKVNKHLINFVVKTTKTFL